MTTKPIMRTLLLFLMVLSGCITTNVKGYTDISYNGYKINKVAVRAPNAGFEFGELLETSMVEELRIRGIKADSFLAMFPPTREWTNVEVASSLAEKGYDSIMYINLVGSDIDDQTIWYINSGNAYIYANTASYSRYSTPVGGLFRYTSTRVRLCEVQNANVIWVGNSTTEAGGLLFVGDEKQADSIASEVVNALAESGHL